MWPCPHCTGADDGPVGLPPYRTGGSIPGRRVVHPAAADHRRHDLHVAQLLGLEHASGSRSRTTRSARKPGRSLPRRRSSPASQAGVTVEACSACSTVSASSRPPGRPIVDRPQHAGARSRPAGRAPRPARRSRSRAPRPSRAASGTRRCRRAGRPRSARRGRGRRARARTAPSRRPRARRSAATSSGARHCACSIRCRSPSGAQISRVASNASSASRFARSPIACTATGQPARAPRARSPPAPRRS